jgi:hypothetical protein
MPYIKTERRASLKRVSGANNAGELNYEVTTLALSYLLSQGKSYETLNEIVGVLTCVGQEFYRRVATAYEDGKRAENGDVF